MLKLLFFIFKILMGGVLLLFFLNYPGTLSIHWLGYHFEMSLLLFLIGFFIIFSGLVLLVKGLKALWNLPSKLYRLYILKQSETAHKNLWCALSAYLFNDFKEALKRLELPLKETNTRPFALFLGGSLAKKSGDTLKAQENFLELLKISGAEPLAYRALISLTQGLDQHRFCQRALPYLHQAPQLAKDVFQIFLSSDRFQDAQKALSLLQKSSEKYLAKGDLKALESRFFHARAQYESRLNNQDKALEDAQKAYVLHPTLEGSLLYGRLLIDQKNTKKAQKFLEKLWVQFPEKPLLDLYAQLYETASPLVQYQEIEKFTQSQPFHPETLKGRALFAFKAELWGIAAQHLQDYQNHWPKDQNVLFLRAFYEEKANQDPQAALAWLKKLNNNLIED